LTIRALACEMIQQSYEWLGAQGGDMPRLIEPGAIRALLSSISRFGAAPALLLTFAVTLGIAVPALAQDKEVDLRLSLWVPPAHPLTGAAKAWADDIAKASNGTIKITIFPSEQLGKAFDHYDMARDDIADITYVNPGYQPGRFPIIAIGQMPFTFGDARKGTAALDSWYRKYAPMEMKDTHFCLAFIHDPGALHSRKKIVLPQDLRGVKVRPAQSTIAELVTRLGGTNVQASAPEAREVLERGVADAITFPWGSLYLFGIDKVVKHHIDAPFYTTVFTFSMNKDKYESLSPAQKRVMDDHCSTDWAVKIAGPWGDFEAAGRDKMRADPTHELYKLTSDQMQAWRATVEPLKASWANAVKQAGADPDAALAELNAAIAKYGAGL
jgi:TRAP-type transport system periplasmic protein